MTTPTYRYLDLEPGSWSGCAITGLVADDDGALRLAPVQGDPVTVGGGAGAIAGAAGLGVGLDGTIYVADPACDRVMVIACDGSSAPASCLRGPGRLPGEVRAPEAVLAGPRGLLYVADTGNRRIQALDPATGAVSGVFGGFDAPVDLAADRFGRLYVADRDAPAIVRLDADGVPDPDFAAAVATSGAAARKPRAIAILGRGENERLLIVDGAPKSGEPALRVFALDGTPDAALGAALADIVAEEIVQATADADTLYVAGPGGVLAFALDGTLLGRVGDVHGAAAALALDCAGRLVVGGTAGVTRLEAMRRVASGRMLLGPLPLPNGADRWDRVVVELLDPIAAGAHVRIWTRTEATGTTPPPPPEAPDPQPHSGRDPAGTWRAAPLDAHDALVLNDPAQALWICVDLAGDAQATPAVRAVRVDFLAGGLRARLPVVYAAEDRDEILWQLINLLAAPLDELDAAIADLPRLFDAYAVPDRAEAPWLDALAGWVGQQLDDRLDDRQRRELVATAFALHGRRGTRAALEAVLSRAAGAPVTVAEPAAEASLWRLGVDAAMLGFATMLVPAHADGAVVGTTADVDRSHLITDDDLGWPLYADVAHRICVRVAAAGLTPERRSGLEAAIEREKPAHTHAHLCVVAPRTTVGFQARIGIDMFVGGDAPDLHLGDALDGGAALRGATPNGVVAAGIEEQTRVGSPAHVLGGR